MKLNSSNLKKIFFCLFVIIQLISIDLKAQDKLQISGFVSGMPTFMFTDIQKQWSNDFTLHNRFDFNYSPSQKIAFQAGLRNRLITGNMISAGLLQPNQYNTDLGWMDLTENLSSGNSYILNTSIDRLLMNLTFDKLEITIGRQRINWGISTAWNPNDIFNAYSFFDFDYEKRPGSDALRFKYYTGSTSVIEFATSVDRDNKITSALFSRFSYKNTDFQISSGVFKTDNFYFGAGLSGYLNKLGLKGEASAFVPTDNRNKTIWSVTFGADYLFENSLSLIAEFLYQSQTNQNTLSDGLFSVNNIDARSLSFSKYSIFASAAYPVTPLINASLSAMYYPELLGFFINPTVECSISSNLYLSAVAQYFYIDQQPTKINMSIIYLRLKLNF